jgi:putative ABC transport system permease protein
MLQDVRYCIRLFQRSPGFSAAVVLTLALGLGLTTAIFSVVDGVLLRPLPYSHPAALVTGPSVSSEAWTEWRQRTAAFDDIALYDFGVAQLLFAGDETARIRQAAVSSNFLSVLGVRPLLGRDFEPADSQPGAEFVVLLTYQAWQQYFGGQANVVGKLAPFDPAQRRVIGVLPADFVFPMRFLASAGAIRMLTPIAMPSQPRYTFGIVARLKRGVSLRQARVEDLAMGQRPAAGTAVPSTSKLTFLSEDMLGSSRRPLLFLFVAVGLLLLIACANAGNMLFAKGAEARWEFAVRFALGASRGALARLVVIQGCALSVTGALLGVLGPNWSIDR